jgi:hypothetical protein
MPQAVFRSDHLLRLTSVAYGFTYLGLSLLRGELKDLLEEKG